MVGAQGLLLVFGAGGSLGVFQAGAVVLVLAAVVCAFLPLPAREAASLLAAVAVAAGALQAVEAGLVGGLALAWLVLAVGTVAFGVASFGVGIGTSRAAAGVVAALLLCAGMTATFWADDVADELRVDRRRSVRQAIVHVDLLLACAYGAADHDRLHDEDVYTTVPLASALIEPPRPLATGALWLGVGLAFAGAAWAVRSRQGG